MEDLYTWVGNITGYFIFLAVMSNLIPGKKYEKYIRLFTGMVAILLIMKPLTSRLRLEERLAHFYEALVFQYQSEDLKMEISEIGEQRLQQMISQYEEAAARDVKMIAEDMGLTVLACKVEIGREEGDRQFGMVERVRMEVCFNKDEERREGEDNSTGEIGVWEKAEIEPVIIRQAASRKDNAELSAAEKGNIGEGNEEVSDFQREEAVAVGKLRRKILSYYDLEEAYVEIQVVEG